jgi:hypothetical protein
MIAVALLLLTVVVVLIAFVALNRRKRLRQAQWHHDYYRRGGLVRSLMANWHRTPRLMDQRPQAERDNL